jgi:hypothetical protein
VNYERVVGFGEAMLRLTAEPGTAIETAVPPLSVMLERKAR